MPEIQVKHIWTDTETGKTTDEPQQKHIDAIASALKKCLLEEKKDEQPNPAA